MDVSPTAAVIVNRYKRIAFVFETQNRNNSNEIVPSFSTKVDFFFLRIQIITIDEKEKVETTKNNIVVVVLKKSSTKKTYTIKTENIR